VGEPFSRTANDADGQAHGAGGLLERERVPSRYGVCNLAVVGRHVQEAAPLGHHVRVDARGHDPSTVGRPIGRYEEGIVQDEWVGCHLAVQRRMPERAGVDGMHSLAKVELEIL
jgi:hypothetical protein